MNSTNPSVSVVIPAYNAGAYIAQALDSCLAQTLDDFEVIIVDDGSNDNTREIVESKGFRISATTHRRGSARARNVGLALAKGRYVKFLDADDVLMARSLEQQLAHASSLSANQISVGSRLVFGDGSSDEGFSLPDWSKVGVSAGMLCRPFEGIQTSQPLHRAEYLRRVAGFDERLQCVQEWNLHARLVLSGAEFVLIQIPTVLYRSHPSPERITYKLQRSGDMHLHRLNAVKLTWEQAREFHAEPAARQWYAETLSELYYGAVSWRAPSVIKLIGQEFKENNLGLWDGDFSSRLRTISNAIGQDRFFSLAAKITEAVRMFVEIRTHAPRWSQLMPARKQTGPE